MLFSTKIKNSPINIVKAGNLSFEIIDPKEMTDPRALFFMKKTMHFDMDPFSREWFWRTNPRKLIYIVKEKGEIVHYGRILYKGEKTREVRLGKGEAYIGPCFTVPDKRGMGIYPFALRNIVQEFFETGFEKIYIASDIYNKASIKGIFKAGFSHDSSGFLVRFLLLSFFFTRNDFIASSPQPAPSLGIAKDPPDDQRVEETM